MTPHRRIPLPSLGIARERKAFLTLASLSPCQTRIVGEVVRSGLGRGGGGSSSVAGLPCRFTTPSLATLTSRPLDPCIEAKTPHSAAPARLHLHSKTLCPACLTLMSPLTSFPLTLISLYPATNSATVRCSMSATSLSPAAH